MGNAKPTEQDLTRRHFLQASGGLAAGASLLGLAGCSGGEASSGPDVHIKIPDAKTKLP
ncbi:MAG: twin-arginine translocation signal domain-containing protein, partial [Streptosporangiaceae bacterium]